MLALPIYWPSFARLAVTQLGYRTIDDVSQVLLTHGITRICNDRAVVQFIPFEGWTILLDHVPPKQATLPIAATMPRPEVTADAVLTILQDHKGRATAIKGNHIAQALGHRAPYGDRPVRAAVEQLRRDGILILATTERPAGYFLAANAEEWRRYGHSLRSRATKIWKTVRAMDKAASAHFGTPEELRPTVQLDLGIT